MKKLLKLALLASLSFGLVACGGTTSESTPTPGGSDSAKPSEPATQHTLDVKINGSTSVGGTAVFVASLDGSPIADQASVTYTCADAEAMTITGNKAVLNKVGTFSVTAKTTAEDKTEVTTTFDVTVKSEFTTIAEIKNLEVGTQVKVQGVVTSIVTDSTGENNVAFYISDETGSIFVQDKFNKNVAPMVQRLNKITLTAYVDFYQDIFQLSSQTGKPMEATIDEEVAEVPTFDYAIKDKKIVDMAKFDTAYANNTYIFHCKIATYQGASYINYEVMDENGKYLAIYSQSGNVNCPELEWLNPYVESGKFYDVAYYVQGKTGSGFTRGAVLNVFEDTATDGPVAA